MFNFKNILKFNDPFEHYIIDNVLDTKFALDISNEFPHYDDNEWFEYSNYVETKKALNNWNKFKNNTYTLLYYLNSNNFITEIKNLTNINILFADNGLHGGGLHIHKNNDKLNIHLDYSIHPKLNLKRKFNLIIYLTPNWEYNWGGNLEFWSHDIEKNQPQKKIKVIENKFNRAVLFDTSKNCWHGFPESIKCPNNIYRKSIASYYLTEKDDKTDIRYRALYAPTEEQKNNSDILNFIKKRSQYYDLL